MPSIRGIALVLGVVVLFGPTSAWAAPLTLNYAGRAYDRIFSPLTPMGVDVSQGFHGLTIPVFTNAPIGGISSLVRPTPGSPTRFDSPFELFVTLSNIDGDSYKSATISFLGNISGTLSAQGISSNITGAFSGGASSGTISTLGVDAAMLPSWFTGMHVDVQGGVGGGFQNLLSVDLKIVPGQSVPEPSSGLVVSLVFAALALGFRGRQNRSAG